MDFERLQFKVHASKTEHHADGGVRMVPMFPELRPLFQDAFDQAPEGTIYCLHQYKGQWSNLGVHMARIIRRAGLEPWPKLFQNLRSTRETELFRMTGGNVKAVCSWIGNTPGVAMQHYAQVTEADFNEAAKMSIIGHAEKALQKPMQTGADSPCTEPHERSDDLDVTLCECETKERNARLCNNMQEDRNWALLDLNKKSQVTKNKILTKSAIPDALQKALHLDNVPSEFKTFINNWAHLPEAVRTAILLLAQQGGQNK